MAEHMLSINAQLASQQESINAQLTQFQQQLQQQDNGGGRGGSSSSPSDMPQAAPPAADDQGLGEELRQAQAKIQQLEQELARAKAQP